MSTRFACCDRVQMRPRMGAGAGMTVLRNVAQRRAAHGFRKLVFEIPNFAPDTASGGAPKVVAGGQDGVKSGTNGAGGVEFARDFLIPAAQAAVRDAGKDPAAAGAPQSLLRLDPQTHTFPYRDFPESLPTPYEVLNRNKKLRVDQYNIRDGAERLSVSSLSPGWCELRKLYDIYASYEKEPSKEMLQGTAIHERLETQTHPTVDTGALIDAFAREAAKAGVSLTKMMEEDQDLQADITSLLDSDPAIPVAAQITRLLSLFTMGHAREVRAIAFIDPATSRIVDCSSGADVDTRDGLVMASGIIDHLIFVPSEDPDDWSVHEELAMYEDDLQEFFRQAPAVLSTNAFVPQILVSDIKTRGWRNLPKQLNVLRANEFQVLCYRKLLGIMGGERFETSAREDHSESVVEFCYRLLVENMKRRQIDVDQPVPPELVLPLLYKNKSLIADAVRLKEGDSFDFAPFDNLVSETDHSCDLSQFKGVKSYDDDYTVLDGRIFEGKWAKPFTVRFLLMRLAQFYELMEPYLSDRCSIEYVARSSDSLQAFKTTYHHYQNDLVNAGLRHSIDFYLTKKGDKVSLINPRSFKTYCDPPPSVRNGGCRYREWCGWYQEHKPTLHSTI